MVITFWRGLLPAALAALAVSAMAQTPTSAERKLPLPDPLEARATVPPVVYTSAFTRYRRTAQDTAIPWREANDTVARIGGWRAYAREAQQPEPPTPVPPVPTSPSMPLATPASTPTPPAASGSAGQARTGGHTGHTQP